MSDPRSVISGANLLSRRIFPNHTVAADEEAARHEAFRVATGRRSSYTNYYESATANAQRTLTGTFDRIRAFDFWAIDRGHNLAGKQVIGECSDDGFVTTQTVFDIVLPTATAPGSLDDALGVRTAEGAWLKRTPVRAAKAARLRIPAMGVGLKPKIVGLSISLSFAFDPWRPSAPDRDELGGDAAESDAGWQGLSAPWQRRTDTLRIQLDSLFDYDVALGAFQHFFARRPTWYVPDENQAQNAMQVIRTLGVTGFGREPAYFPHQAQIPIQEWEPANA